MVERLVSTILQRYLGDFLEGLEGGNLRISILNGLLEQRNVRFRPEALKNLNLPVTVKSGSVKTLTIQVPITSLSTQATRVVLDEVFVVAGPGHCIYDEGFENRLQETKKRRLQVAEALKGDPEEARKGGLFGRTSLGKMAETIVQNLTLQVNRVHIRYEDVDVNGKPFAAGLTLEGLHAVAADGNWNASIGGALEGAFRKLVQLRNLSIYWDQDSPPLEFTSLEEMSRAMAALIFSSAAAGGTPTPPPPPSPGVAVAATPLQLHNYIIPPISSTAKFTLNQSFESTKLPQIDISLALEAIRIILCQSQWRQLTKIMDGVSNEMRGLLYRRFRPKEPLNATTALEWWRYAIQSIVSDNRQHAQQWTWSWIDQMAKDRRDYVTLWYYKLRNNKKKGCFSKEQKQKKREITERRTFEQIMAFRSIAESLYFRQRERVAQSRAASKNPFTRAKEEKELMELKLEALTTEEWYRLREGLQNAETGDDRFHQKPSTMPPDYVRQNVSVALSGASVLLQDDETDVSRPLRIVELDLNVATARVQGIEDGTLRLGASLHSLNVSDWHSRPGEATAVVQPTAAADTTVMRIDEAGTNDSISSSLSLPPPLVELSLESSLRDDPKLFVRARSLDVVFSIPLVLRIRDFFASGGAAEALKHLHEDAVHRSEQSLKVEQKRPLHLRVEVDAPNVVFSDGFQRWPNTTRLVGALGRLVLTSDSDDHYSASITRICAGVAFPALNVWQRALGPEGGEPGLWTNILRETSIGVEISLKPGLRKSETLVSIVGRFTEAPRLFVNAPIIVDIVRVSVGLAMAAISADPLDSSDGPLETAIHLTLHMPIVELNVGGLLGADLTRIDLVDTTLTVERHYSRKVDVRLGMGSLEALDLVTHVGKMVWSEAAEEGRKLVNLHVSTVPDEEVRVSLDLDRIQVAMQRETTLEVVGFSESLGKEIDVLIPPQLRSKKMRKNAPTVDFLLTTRDLSVSLLRGGTPFLLLGLAASRIRIATGQTHNAVELVLGALTIEDLLSQGPYRTILSTRGLHTADIKIETWAPSDPLHPGYELCVIATLSTVQFIVIMPLIRDLQSYFSELEEMKTLLAQKAGQAATDAVRSTARVALALNVQSSVVLIPATFGGDQCFEARVGQIVVDAKPQSPTKISITNTAVMSARFVDGTTDASRMQHVLREWSGAITIDRRSTGPETGVQQPLQQDQDLSIFCHADSLRVQINEEQVGLIFSLLENNVWQPGRFARKRGGGGGGGAAAAAATTTVSAEGADGDDNDDNDDDDDDDDDDSSHTVDLNSTVERIRHRDLLRASIAANHPSQAVLSSPIESINNNNNDTADPPPPPPPPLTLKVDLLFREVSLEAGTGNGIPLCSLNCRRLSVTMSASPRVSVLLSLENAQLLDTRPSQTPSTIPLLASINPDTALFQMQFQAAENDDQFDDVGLKVGAVRAIVDPTWLLALFRVLLPCIDRVLHMRENMVHLRDEVQIRSGSHLLLQIESPQVALVEDERKLQSCALVLSSSLITLERTEGPDLSSAMDLNLKGIEVWKTRMGTQERASIVFPLDVSVSWEEIPHELASTSVTVGFMQVEFSYHDLILLVALGEKWKPWGDATAKTASAASSNAAANLLATGKNSRQRLSKMLLGIAEEDGSSSSSGDNDDNEGNNDDYNDPLGLSGAISRRRGGGPSSSTQPVMASFRLELFANRALAPHVADGLPHPTLSLRRRLDSEGEHQLFRYSAGRIVSDGKGEAEWCFTVDWPPLNGSAIFMAQVHSAKAPAQLWDWLPCVGTGKSLGRLVLRSHPSWCLATVGGAMVDGTTLELQAVVGDGDSMALQLWYVPAAWTAQMTRPASPARPLLNRSSSRASPLSAATSPSRIAGSSRRADDSMSQQPLVVPQRWTAQPPPEAQQISIHLLGGLNARLVDDLAGNVRPIVRLRLQETLVQVSNWSNGGDMHCVFTVSLEADYFNEDSEAWEPLLRGIEKIQSPTGRERSLDVQLSLTRAPEKDGSSSLRCNAMATGALSLTVSRALVPTGIRLWDAWARRKDVQDRPVSRPSPSLPSLSNETGQAVRWKGLRSITGAGVVEPGTRVNMPMERTETGSSTVLGLRVGSGRWLTCRIDSVGAHAYRLDEGLTAVVEVSTRKLGGREVIVRSNVLFHNLTDHPLMVSGCNLVVQPQQRAPVPFDGLHLTLQLCPDTNMYSWSEKSLVPATLLQRTPERVGSTTTREACDMFRCQHLFGGSSWSWALEVHGQLGHDSSRCWTWEIWCRAPLTLRNLLHSSCSYRLVSKRGLEDDILYEGHLERGHSQPLYRVGNLESLFLQLKLPGYKWSAAMKLGGPNVASGTRSERIQLDHVVEGGARTVSIFAAYWLVNDTGAPCTWVEAPTGQPVPGQKVGVDVPPLTGPPVSWFRGNDESLRLPLLFWKGTPLAFQTGSGAHCATSSPLTLDSNMAAMGAIEVPGPQGSLLHFGLQNFNAPGEYWRTKVVQLSNRYVLVNATGRPLLYGQVGAAQEFVLSPDTQVPFHWADATQKRLLHVRWDDGESRWSGGFALRDVALFELALRNDRSLESSRIAVQSVTEGPTTAVIFYDAVGRVPLYAIRNNTSIPLVAKQVGVYDAGEEIPPRSSVPWAWSEPSATERLVQVLPVAGSGIELDSGVAVPRFSLDEVAALGVFRLTKRGWKIPVVCRVTLVLSGVTKVLSIEQDRTAAEKAALREEDFEVVRDFVPSLSLKFSLPGISVSLVSGAPAEIFHAWLDSISLELESDATERMLQLEVANCQVDSQISNKVYDTVLWGKTDSQKPVFHLAIAMGTTYGGSGIAFFNGIEVVLQELNVAVDEAIVTHVLSAVYDLLEYLDRSLNQEVVRRVPDYTKEKLNTSDFIYAKLLFFGPVRVTLSYSSCPWGAASLKGDVVEKILSTLGPVSGLERAALQLNSLRLDNAFSTKANLVKTIAQHYRQTAASKLLLLLGSAHFIGSPITLVESIGTGFWDLWYEPVLGLTHSPKAFAEGVSRGTRSMLSKTVYGVAKSASDLTGSIGNVTAQLSFDPQYIQERERDRKQQAQHVGEGLAYGIYDFGKGLFDGVTGLVTRPVVGAREEGVGGFFKGIGRGLTGVVVKPIAGTLGMASRITEGVKNTANRAERVERVRLPRFIGASGVIQCFNAAQAEGQAILYGLNAGAFQREFYAFHYPPMDAHFYPKPGQKLSAAAVDSLPLRTTRIVVSNRDVFCVKGTAVGSLEIVWHAPLLMVMAVRRTMADSSLCLDIKGNPLKVLKAGPFYTHELTYLCLVVQKMAKEAQGAHEVDDDDDDGGGGGGVLVVVDDVDDGPAARISPAVVGKDKEEGLEDGFVDVGGSDVAMTGFHSIN